MPIQSPTRHSLPHAERPSGARGAAALRAATQADLRLVHGDGTEEALTLPASSLPALADLLERLSSADSVTVLADDAEVTPARATTDGCRSVAVPARRRASGWPMYWSFAREKNRFARLWKRCPPTLKTSSERMAAETHPFHRLRHSHNLLAAVKTL